MKRSQNLQVILVSVVLTGLLSLFSPATAFADEYHIQWKKNFGGMGYDRYASAKATFSRESESPGCIVVGYSAAESFGNGDWTGVEGKGSNDAIIVKYDHSEGNVMWKKNFGGSGNDIFWTVIATPQGYVAAGESDASSFGNGDWTDVDGKGSNDAIIVSYDYEGYMMWKKNFGGSSNDVYYAVTAVSDGFVAVGASLEGSFGNGNWTDVTGKGHCDAIIVKYDNDGNVVWKKNFGGIGYDQYNWVTEVSDGIVAAGYSYPASFGNGDWAGVEGKGGQDAIIVKYDNDGNVVWKKNFGGSADDLFISVTTVSDGVVAVGVSGFGSFGNGDWTSVTGKGGEDGIIVKYDNDGNVVWKKNFGGSGNDYNFAVTTVSDGIVAIGYTPYNSFNNGDWIGIMGKGGISDATMVKYDHAGNVLWKGNFGGDGHNEFIWATETMTGFVVVGSSSEESFGTGDWTGVEGKGEYDGVIVKFVPYIVTFIPVTDIINVPTSTKVGVPLTLSGKVVPGDATYQTFTWSVKNAGTTGATISNGNILNTTGTGVVVVTATIENGLGEGIPFKKDFNIAVNPADFVPVTDIKDVPTSTTEKIPLTLTGTVVPSNATNKTIVWSVQNAGTTGATISSGNILNTTAMGTVIVKATIANGIGIGVNFVKEFTIAVNPVGFVPVIDIINVPQATIVEIPLTLTGTVVPSNATYKTIVWSIKNAGGTGATITDGNILNPTTVAGKVVVTATIENGVGIGISFMKDFTIAINAEGFVPVIDIIDVPTSTTEKIPLTLTGTVIPDNATYQTIKWSVKDKGTTGATISDGNILNTKTAGIAIVSATIANGVGIGIAFTKEFTITVEEDVNIPEISQPNALKAYTQNGVLYVSGLTVGKIWSVYNILGELVYQGTATAEEANISLPVSGMYIILSEDKVVKVVNH